MARPSPLRVSTLAPTFALICVLPVLHPAPLTGQEQTTAQERERALQEELQAPRPVEALESVWLEELTWMEPRDDGYHDYYWITAQQMVTAPATVRYDERVAAGLAHINGISIAPMPETIEVGRRLIEFRVDSAVEAIHASLAAGR